MDGHGSDADCIPGFSVFHALTRGKAARLGGLGQLLAAFWPAMWP